MPPWRGFPGMSHCDEASRMTQEMLERRSLPDGLGTSRDFPGRTEQSGRGSLGFCSSDSISDKQKMLNGPNNLRICSQRARPQRLAYEQCKKIIED